MLKPSSCDLPDHDFVPIRSATILPSRWVWRCRRCQAVMHRFIQADVISARDLNKMVDTSLRHADRVVRDDQGIKGEKHIYRNAEWEFRPFRFEIAYHIVSDISFVLLFDSFDLNDIIGTTRTPIVDTARYRELLNLSKAMKTGAI